MRLRVPSVPGIMNEDCFIDVLRRKPGVWEVFWEGKKVGDVMRGEDGKWRQFSSSPPWNGADDLKFPFKTMRNAAITMVY